MRQVYFYDIYSKYIGFFLARRNVPAFLYPTVRPPTANISRLCSIILSSFAKCQDLSYAFYENYFPVLLSLQKTNSLR